MHCIVAEEFLFDYLPKQTHWEEDYSFMLLRKINSIERKENYRSFQGRNPNSLTNDDDAYSKGPNPKKVREK